MFRLALLVTWDCLHYYEKGDHTTAYLKEGWPFPSIINSYIQGNLKQVAPLHLNENPSLQTSDLSPDSLPSFMGNIKYVLYFFSFFFLSVITITETFSKKITEVIAQIDQVQA